MRGHKARVAPSAGSGFAGSREQLTRLGAALTLASALLHLLHVVGMGRRSIPWVWFNMDAESTLVVWFSSTLLFATGMAAWYCHTRESAMRPAVSRSGGWLLTGFIFIYLSVDETAMLHERTGRLFVQWMPAQVVQGVVFHHWLVAFTPALILAVWHLTVFLRRRFLGRPQLLWFLGAGLASWLGVIGLELLSGLIPLSRIERVQWAGWEEFLELFGTICFLLTFLRYGATLNRVIASTTGSLGHQP